MIKFIVNEEEKNRILNLHKKLISEQSLGNTRFDTASRTLGATQLPSVFRTATSQPSTEVEGEVSSSFFEQNQMGDYSEETTAAETPSGTTSSFSGSTTPPSGSSFKDTTLTIEDLKKGKTVSIGMKGPVVGEIQKLLIARGFKDVSKSGEPDNIFGRLTKGEVEKFQLANKNDKGNQLKKDGIVGVETITALLKVTDEDKKKAGGEIPTKVKDSNFGKID